MKLLACHLLLFAVLLPTIRASLSDGSKDASLLSGEQQSGPKPVVGKKLVARRTPRIAKSRKQRSKPAGELIKKTGTKIEGRDAPDDICRVEKDGCAFVDGRGGGY